MPLFRRKKNRETVDLEARSPELGLKYKDLLVLDQLIKAGADLTRPRHALYYLYFASSEVAVAAADEARGGSFEAEVREPLEGANNQWSVICEQHGVVLEAATVRENTDYFEALAQRHGGDYDGWEASV